MAELKYCSACEETRECTKKGFNKDGEQMWYCKTCGKKFVDKKTVPAKKATVKKATVTSASKKTVAKVSPAVKGTTEIVVNNNTIKTVPGLLTLDQAFDMVSSYFKEIAKEKAEISERNDKKTIKFKVTAGGKGEK